MHAIKKFLLIMTLAAFAYHLELFAQTRVPTPQENLYKLMFLTENSLGGTNLNRVDIGRSSLLTNELTQAKIKPGSLSWTTAGVSKLLSYSLVSEDNTHNLKLSIVTTTPTFTVKTVSMPENFKKDYEFSTWIAKTPTLLFAANNTSVYQITLGGTAQNKATLIHQAGSIEDGLKLNILSFDISMQNLIFAYAKPSQTTYYGYNLEKKKLSKIDVAPSCKGKVVQLRNKLIPMGESNFLVYCAATLSTRPAFLLLDFTKLTVTRLETKEELTVDSDFSVDKFGYYVVVKKAAERVLYCNGNIKQIQSVRCLNTATMATGYIFSTDNLAQFYIISARNIFALDFSTGVTRRTSIMFSNALSGPVIDPISL